MVFHRTKAGEDFIPEPWLIKTPEPITPEEAEQRVQQLLDMNEGDYDRVLLGVAYAGTERFVPIGGTA
jgi:hypothetical protein